MWGFQASGAAPIVNGAPVRNPQTIATAIRIGNPASWAVRRSQARDESGGLIDAVTDRQILAAYRLLASQEGVFVEPASAASVAGLLKAAEEGKARPGAARSSARSPATASRTPTGRWPARRSRSPCRSTPTRPRNGSDLA